jgi:hypothetical protein
MAINAHNNQGNSQKYGTSAYTTLACHCKIDNQSTLSTVAPAIAIAAFDHVEETVRVAITRPRTGKPVPLAQQASLSNTPKHNDTATPAPTVPK